jgi:DNA-directed RNA polymerase specialized sigma24 family protein
MKALKKIQTFKLDDKNTFKSWIFTIAYNTLIDYTRTNKGDVSLEY